MTRKRIVRNYTTLHWGIYHKIAQFIYNTVTTIVTKLSCSFEQLTTLSTAPLYFSTLMLYFLFRIIFNFVTVVCPFLDV